MTPIGHLTQILLASIHDPRHLVVLCLKQVSKPPPRYSLLESRESRLKYERSNCAHSTAGMEFLGIGNKLDVRYRLIRLPTMGYSVLCMYYVWLCILRMILLTVSTDT
ncbi:hypothetical protein P152DRAFT_459308 [Eremomyces bilateralis CBS 781.70]|uniref:Uncharacterized protein n=1 Tax=Eremomyces bilateralis CBS 781.70 TaxID=1392243 RepID=A0A6G1G1M5_9PEZI|nr:uncharacterized protein P152DRAFT_459308 [Eremomyces bilateralis CBS 781.70]KAF1811826.1 hypothetical protein P152DRAFT_459308 [Eremomyces bilateralis CBS 781.70]